MDNAESCFFELRKSFIFLNSTLFLAYYKAFSSYSFSSLVINSFKPIEFKILADTLAEKLFPILVKTGNPIHNASEVVVCPLYHKVSKPKSPREYLAR